VPPSLYGFVREREPVSPEEVAADFLAQPNLNGDARARIEALIEGDSRFVWDESGALGTADTLALPIGEAPYVVFDVETTGSSAKTGGAITEIGALKVVGGQVVDRFATLINPQRPIEPFVVRLTGITNRMVEDAPTAAEVMPLFGDFVEGCVLVGHNVAFDCGFVTAARKGAGLQPLENPVLDTLRLARLLVPGLKRYRLASLVQHLGVREAPNHRALADAAATAEVFLKLLKFLKSAGVGTVGEATTLKGSGKSRVAPQKGHLADGLPRTPGVYYFVDKNDTVLYVGKAKDLKARVRTYFNGGDGRRKIGRLVREAAEVRHTETGTELEALILESREIKRLLPRFNAAGRGDRPGWFLELSAAEPYPLPKRIPAETAPGDGAVRLGPYRSAGTLDACVEALGRIFPLRRCKGEGPLAADAEPCFYGQMGRCGPCLGMTPEEYRASVVDEIAALLRGEGGEEYLIALVAERDRLAGELEFEAAARLRDLISGIERVRLARSVVTSEGLSAVVAPSTEPGMVEAFALAAGRLFVHSGFVPGDAVGLASFVEEALERHRVAPHYGGTSDEARIVAAYLRRRQAPVEAVRLLGPESAGALVAAARRVSERAEEVAVEAPEAVSVGGMVR
jgi:DNA polymerase-3 subunit epsilon